MANRCWRGILFAARSAYVYYSDIEILIERRVSSAFSWCGNLRVVVLYKICESAIIPWQQLCTCIENYYSITIYNNADGYKAEISSYKQICFFFLNDNVSMFKCISVSSLMETNSGVCLAAEWLYIPGCVNKSRIVNMNKRYQLCCVHSLIPLSAASPHYCTLFCGFYCCWL